MLQEYVLGNHEDVEFFAGKKSVSHKAMLLFGADSSQMFSAEYIEQSVVGDEARRQLRQSRSYLKHFLAIKGPAVNNNVPPIRGVFVPETGQGTMEFWLEGSRSVAATDPRDKVYSLLGISNEISELNDTRLYDPDRLIYDYGSSMEDVHSSAVRAIVSGTRRLDILMYCSKPGPLVNRTWTPDWTVGMKPNFYYTSHSNPLNRYQSGR